MLSRPAQLHPRSGMAAARRGMTARRRACARRGMALMDVIIGGIILGIGLTVVISLTTRSLATQTEGEKQMTASWLIDEIFGMVLAEGPDIYKKTENLHSRFNAPFDDFEYDVSIEDQGLNSPFLVTAVVRWPHGPSFREAQAQTLIANRVEQFELRKPPEPIDRYSRWYPDEAQNNAP